jgi:glycosyltransferase involved in cell wall biosynthesis
MPPRLSVIILTWNEERNIGSCLRALAQSVERDFEVLVVDAASTDGTAGIVESARAAFPVPLRFVASDRRIPIGEARNRGVALTASPLVAFVSADAEVAPDWTARVIHGLESCDLVFGRQVHAPHRWTVGAATRGLRYHFPARPSVRPLRYASNVAAGFNRAVLDAFPFDPSAQASEDVLLARRATAAGFRVAYDPEMVVAHHDVAGAREELRKNLREGEACGRHATELGVDWAIVGWVAALLGAGIVCYLQPAYGILALAFVAWAPAARRVVRRREAMPASAAARGFLASPFFDLAFAFQYLRGMALGPKRVLPFGGLREAQA